MCLGLVLRLLVAPNMAEVETKVRKSMTRRILGRRSGDLYPCMVGWMLYSRMAIRGPMSLYTHVCVGGARAAMCGWWVWLGSKVTVYV